MKTIWKFPLVIEDSQIVRMPRGAEILTVQVQNGVPCLWALVDDRYPKQVRKFDIVGTGNPFDPASTAYIGTFQLEGGALVFHVFEVYP